MACALNGGVPVTSVTMSLFKVVENHVEVVPVDSSMARGLIYVSDMP